MALWRAPHRYGYVLGGRVVQNAQARVMGVINKHTQEQASEVELADKSAMEEALSAANGARGAMAALAPHKRKEILTAIANDLREKRSSFESALVIEAGKTITDASVEVNRAIDTFAVAAEEAVRIDGKMIPLDYSSTNTGLSAITKRFPRGVVGMITPFNFPLNLVAHKVAPAIAAGCPFVVKPADRTPISALMLGELMCDKGLPDGAFSVLPCETEVASRITTDPSRVHTLSFTGSPGVGWKLKGMAGQKKVVLELGGNAPCIVDEGSDLAFAAKRVAFGAYYYAGQTCISVQRVYALDSVYDEFRELLAAETRALNERKGDPWDRNTFMSPMIAPDETKRVASWVEDAQSKGANVVAGGGIDGFIHHATLVENVSDDVALSCQEVFGPVCVLNKVSSFEEAVARSDDSEFGLQAGVFTPSLKNAFYAFNNIETGSVVINEIPTTRADPQPYGGVKGSGLGREGLRPSIEEFTEERCMLTKGLL